MLQGWIGRGHSYTPHKNVCNNYYVLSETQPEGRVSNVTVLTENELGESALDVSRKLKHLDCEALVRSNTLAAYCVTLLLHKFYTLLVCICLCVCTRGHIAATSPVQPIWPSCPCGVRVAAPAGWPLRQRWRLWGEGDKIVSHFHNLVLSFKPFIVKN